MSDHIDNRTYVCEHCNAEPKLIDANHYGPGIHRIEIRHDSWCPWLRANR